jgi:integrase
LYALFAVAIALGMRRGEALGLRGEDVDLVEGTITMAMQLQRVAGKLRDDETKTDDSTRMVALPQPCVRALRGIEHSRHSSIGVTSAIYVDVLQEVQRDAVDRLGHLFGPDDESDT